MIFLWLFNLSSFNNKSIDLFFLNPNITNFITEFSELIFPLKNNMILSEGTLQKEAILKMEKKSIQIRIFYCFCVSFGATLGP